MFYSDFNGLGICMHNLNELQSFTKSSDIILVQGKLGETPPPHVVPGEGGMRISLSGRSMTPGHM